MHPNGGQRRGVAEESVRLAERGACVPWAAMAAIERARVDAEGRRLVAGPGRARAWRDRLTGWLRRSR